MRGPKEILKYIFGSGTGNTRNMVRAGRNNSTWGTVGGAIVGALLGSIAFPIGTILGLFVGGLLGSALNYGKAR